MILLMNCIHDIDPFWMNSKYISAAFWITTKWLEKKYQNCQRI